MTWLRLICVVPRWQGWQRAVFPSMTNGNNMINNVLYHRNMTKYSRDWTPGRGKGKELLPSSDKSWDFFVIKFWGVFLEQQRGGYSGEGRGGKGKGGEWRLSWEKYRRWSVSVHRIPSGEARTKIPVSSHASGEIFSGKKVFPRIEFRNR